MPKVVTLTLGGNPGAALMNYPVNSTDFKLIKGITNEIFFFVKDVDRHPITANSLANSGIVDLRIIITDDEDHHLLLGNQNSATTTYTTTFLETTTILSNNTVIITNTTVITSNSVANSSGSNSTVNSNSVSNTPVSNTVLISSVGAGQYTVPDYVNSIVVETWGPGGAAVNSPETGAAGGAYAEKTIPVMTGDTFDYFVGNSATPEQATFWGNSSDPNSATFGAWGGAWISNNVTDVSYQLGSPFGAFDVGFYGGVSNTGQLIGQASAWSGGNAASNPAGLNESNVEGGGPSNGNAGTTPGGGAPAAAGLDTVYGGPGQIRITEIYDQAALANALANSNSVSNSVSNSNVSSNSVTITNTVTTTVTYITNTISYDPSVLIPAPGIDPAKGVWMLSLKASDIADWPIGYLRYGVVGDRLQGDQVMLYTDRNYGPYSDLEVLAGPFPQPPEATIITPEMCVQQGRSLYSGAFPGAAQVGNLSGQHGIVLQLTNFTGSISMQASLENEPPVNSSDWFEANITSSTAGIIDSIGNPSPPPPWNNNNGYGGTITFSTETNGPIYVSAVGNYMWVRFIVYCVPASGGSWTQIDYRND
jgi:hypothetical protein